MNGFQKVVKIGAICFAIYLIFNILVWSMMGLGLLTSIIGIDEDRKNERAEIYITEGEEQNIIFAEKEYNKIEKIKIDIKYSELYISLTDDNELIVDTDCSKDKIKIETNNNVLRIKEESDWFFRTKSLGKIQINIPQNMNIEKLELDTGAGKIMLNEIRAERLDVNHGAGKFEISNCDFQNTKIKAGAGEVKISDSRLNNLELDAGVGRAEIVGEITGDSEIKCGIGEIDIVLKGEEDYIITAEKGIGSLRINGKSYSSETTYGDGDNRIRIEGGIGAINIKFN